MYILWSVLISSLTHKFLNKKKGYAGSICIDILFSLLLYFYYAGYSKEDYQIFLLSYGFSVKGTFFCIISLVVALVHVLVNKYCIKTNVNKRNTKIWYDVIPKEKLIFLVLLAVSFLVRVIGVRWGAENGTFHPDEGKVVYVPINMALNNTMMSDAIIYPSQISHKFLSILFKLYQVFGNLLDIEFTTLRCHYIGRAYMAIISTATVACVYFIGNKIKRGTGIFAMLLAALFPPFVQAAHCMTGDNLVALCLALAILCALNYMDEENGLKYIVLLSFLAAVAFLEKYHGALLCVLIAMMVLLKNCTRLKMNLKEILIQGVIAILLFLVGIILISPNLINRVPDIIGEFAHLTGDYENGNTFWGNMSGYTSWFLSYMGVLALIPLGYGIIQLIKGKNKNAVVLAIGLVEIIIMCLQNRAFIRWAYPFYICIILIIGVGFEAILGRKKKKSVRRTYVLVLVLLVVNNFAGTVLVDVLYANSEQDTRIAALQYCEEKGIIEEDCIYDHYTCFWYGGYQESGKENNELKNGIISNDNELVKNRVGKSYAISSAGYGYVEDYADYREKLNLVKEFKSDYADDGSMFELYWNFSPKIIELFSIYNSFKVSLDIINKNIYTGYDISIYDISDLSACEVIDFKEFSKETFNEDIVYVKNISCLSAGAYHLEIKGKNQLDILLEDEKGNAIINTIIIQDNHADIELEKNYYNVILKIVNLDEGNTFESITISNV